MTYSWIFPVLHPFQSAILLINEVWFFQKIIMLLIYISFILTPSFMHFLENWLKPHGVVALGSRYQMSKILVFIKISSDKLVFNCTFNLLLKKKKKKNRWELWHTSKSYYYILPFQLSLNLSVKWCTQRLLLTWGRFVENL